MFDKMKNKMNEELSEENEIDLQKLMKYRRDLLVKGGFTIKQAKALIDFSDYLQDMILSFMRVKDETLIDGMVEIIMEHKHDGEKGVVADNEMEIV